jgi:hypothetical protein
MPGVAFSQPADGKIASFYYTMFGNGLLSVGRTTGVKPAVVAQKRAQAGLVAGDQENEETAH